MPVQAVREALSVEPSGGMKLPGHLRANVSYPATVASFYSDIGLGYLEIEDEGQPYRFSFKEASLVGLRPNELEQGKQVFAKLDAKRFAYRVGRDAGTI